MGSCSCRYRRSLRHHRRFLGVIADPCGVITDPCGIVAISEAIDGRAVADVATPIVARLAKHHKTLLNIVKHHETHVKPVWKTGISINLRGIAISAEYI